MSEPHHPTNNFMTWILAAIAPFSWTTKLVAGAVLGLIAPILMTLLGLASVLLAFTAVLFHFAAPETGFPFWEMLGAAFGFAIVRGLVGRIVETIVRR